MVQNWSLKAPKKSSKNRKLFRNCRKNYLIIGAEDYDEMFLRHKGVHTQS